MTKGNMKSKNKHQYELDQLYLKVEASGGRDHCHDLFKKYNREHNAHQKKTAQNHHMILKLLRPCTDQ